MELDENDEIILHESMRQLKGLEQVAITERVQELWSLREAARSSKKGDDVRLLRALGFPIVEIY